MAMSADKVETLRRKLVEEKEIEKIWQYFFDEFADSPGFLAAGQSCECRELDERIELVGRHLFGKARTRVSDQVWGKAHYARFKPADLAAIPAKPGVQ
jgi:hypothetical protein